ncbi:MAG: DUF6268 family outer membrane beta-barrel protein [Bacteroidota bacterium]
MIKNSLILSAFLVLITIQSQSQVWPGPHPLLSSWIKINTEDRIASQVDTFENKFGYYRGEGSFNIPLYRGKDWLTSTGNTPLVGVTLQGAVSYLQPAGDFIPDSLQLLRLRLGGSFIYSKGLRNLYMLNVQGINAHDYASFFNFKGTYVNGSLFWRHRSNDQFSYTLGAVYTSVFGSNKILPLAGISWRPLKEDLITFMFPAYVQYTHFFSRRFAAGVSLRPFGGMYTVNLPVNDSLVLEDVKFRHKEFQLAFKMKLKISYQLSVEPDIGISGRSWVQLGEEKYDISSSAFVRVMIRYKFGKRTNVAPILDFDPADFINADPEIPEN